MIIRSVRLSNIRSYLSQEIGLPQGAVLLSGDIGSGKSTILLAIEFALFGISKGLLSGEALLRHGKQQGYVELQFHLDGKDVIIRRNLKRLKDSVRQDEGYLIINGVKHLCTAEELRARVLEMLGYPKELLKKSKGLIYRFTVYTPQEEMKRILFEDPQVRLDTLRRVFQIEKYKLVREGASVVMQALREKKRELEARIEDLPEKQQQLKQLSENLAAVEKKLAALLPAISQTEQMLQQKQMSLKFLEEKARQVNSLKSQLAATAAVIAEKKNLVLAKEAEIVAARKEISSLKLQLEDNSAYSRQLASSLSRLKSFSDSLLKDVAMRSNLEDELAAAEQRKSEAESEVSRLEALKSASQQLKQKISVLTSCPTCLQPVTDGHKHKISLEEDSKIAELTVKSATAIDKKSSLMQKIKLLKSELNDLQAKEKVAAGLISELKPYFETASLFGIEVRPLPSSPSAAALAVADMQAELSSLASARKKLESSKEKLFMVSEKEKLAALAEKAAAGFRTEAKLLEAKMTELSARVASFGDIEAETGLLQSELDKILGEKTS
ncbi:SMC family ATPase, partial [Candidatus Woesearchaeota archaeon]|nr:SMC family ATPase [Candidatus Woesearchaeota archaeon]